MPSLAGGGSSRGALTSSGSGPSLARREDWAEQAATVTLRLRRVTPAQGHPASLCLCIPEASRRGQEQACAHAFRPPPAMRAQALAHRVLWVRCPPLGTAAPNIGPMEAAQGVRACERPPGQGATFGGREGEGRGGEEAGVQGLGTPSGRWASSSGGRAGAQRVPWRGRCLPNAHLLYYEKSHVWQDPGGEAPGARSWPGTRGEQVCTRPHQRHNQRQMINITEYFLREIVPG